MLTFLSMNRGFVVIRLNPGRCPESLTMATVTVGLIVMTPVSGRRLCQRRTGRLGFRVGTRLHRGAGARMPTATSGPAARGTAMIGTHGAIVAGTAAPARPTEATAPAGAETTAVGAASTARPDTMAATAVALPGRCRLSPGTADAPGMGPVLTVLP